MKGQSLGFSFEYYLIHCQAQYVRFVALEILQKGKFETRKYLFSSHFFYGLYNWFEYFLSYHFIL